MALRWIALTVTVAAAVLSWACEARAQTAPAGQQGAPAIPDSLLNFGYKITPSFEATSGAQVSYNELGSKFSNIIVGSNGLSLNSVLGVSEKNYRLQDRNEREKRFTNLGTMLWSPGLTANLNLSDTRKTSRAALVTGGFQDFIFNNQLASVGGRYISAQRRPYGVDAATTLQLYQNEFAFKKDTGQGGAVNGGARYRILGGSVRVGLRGAYEERSEKSMSSLETFDGLTTTSDSLKANVDLRLVDSLDVGLEYTDYSFEREFADQARTASGSQQIGAENLFREVEIREYERYGVRMSTTPLPALTLTTSAYHTEQLTDYVNTPTRFNRNVSDELSGDLGYTMASGLAVKVGLSNEETLRDLGPQSVSSYEDKRRRASLTLSKRFSKTFDMNVALAQGISQSFYLSPENPRDRDQLDSSVRATINSKPFRKVAARIFLSMTTTDIISINSRFSGDNRTRLRYDFEPDITYEFSERVRVEQGYGLAIEFTDYDYVQPGQDDYIDRNVTFWNRITHQATRRLSTEFYYSLTLHDRGSYLPDDPTNEDPDAERFLDVERKDRTDQTRISFRFRLNDHLTLVGQHDYSRRRDTTVGQSRDRVTTSGGIEGGVQGAYKWGNRGSLNLMVKRVERFSPFVTDKQKSYWDASLTFRYNFL